MSRSNALLEGNDLSLSTRNILKAAPWFFAPPSRSATSMTLDSNSPSKTIPAHSDMLTQ